jgi:hypothetical protein
VIPIRATQPLVRCHAGGVCRAGGLAHRIDVTVGGVTASMLPVTMVFSHLTLTGPRWDYE